LQPTEFRVNSLMGQFKGGLQWLAEGSVRVDGLYQKVCPRDAQAAYQDLLHARAERLASCSTGRRSETGREGT